MRHRWSIVALGAPALAGALVALPHCSWVNDLDTLGAGPTDASSPVEARAPDGSGSVGLDAPLLPSPDGNDVADAAVPDATTDAKADAADAADGADAGVLDEPPIFAEAGADTWCTARATSTFCADFDRSPLPSGFASSEGAFLLLTSTLPSSPSNALALIIPPQAGPGTFSSKLARSFTQPAASVTLAFDFFPEKINTTASGVLFTALDYLGNPQAKYSIRLAYNQGTSRVEESYLGFPTDIFHSTFHLPIGKWSHVRIEMVFGVDGGPSTLSVFVDDALQGSVESLSPPSAFDPRPSLLVGAVYGTLPHTGWALRYDNVLMDIH
jgi:hypothetical protein